MNTIIVYGASDDIIGVDGAIKNEFDVCDIGDDYKYFLGFSDGTMLSVKYDGCWRIARMKAGTSKFSKTEGDPDSEEEVDGYPGYSDVVTLTCDHSNDIKWVVLGKEFAVKSR